MDTMMLRVKKITKIGFIVYIVLFLISFAINFALKGLQPSSPEKTLNYELIAIGFNLLTSIIYFIVLMKFFKFLKLYENYRLKKLIGIITVLIIFNFIVSIGENFIEVILAYVHYLRLTNYALFENYIYVLYFVKLIINLLYFILVLDLFYQSNIKHKLFLYMYIIIFFVRFSLPYLINDPTNNALGFVIAFLSVIEILALYKFVMIPLVNIKGE